MRKIILSILFLVCFFPSSFVGAKEHPVPEMTTVFQSLMTQVFDKNLPVVDGKIIINSQNNEKVLKNNNLFVLTSDGKSINYDLVDCFVRHNGVFCQELNNSSEQTLIPKDSVREVFDKNVSFVNDRFIVNVQDKEQKLKDNILFVLSANGKNIKFTYARCFLREASLFCQELGNTSDYDQETVPQRLEATAACGGVMASYRACETICHNCYDNCGSPPNPECATRCDSLYATCTENRSFCEDNFQSCYDDCGKPPARECTPICDSLRLTLCSSDPDSRPDPWRRLRARCSTNEQSFLDPELTCILEPKPKPNNFNLQCLGYWNPISHHWEVSVNCGFLY